MEEENILSHAQALAVCRAMGEVKSIGGRLHVRIAQDGFWIHVTEHGDGTIEVMRSDEVGFIARGKIERFISQVHFACYYEAD